MGTGLSGLTTDLLTIEDQVYSRLITAMNLTLTNEQAARAVSHPTENLEAYRGTWLAGTRCEASRIQTM